MDLKSYFERKTGLGILSTADVNGRVNAAVYARPHVLDEETVAFVMRERLTHHNLGENPYASYLFQENRGGYRGVRLSLLKIKEETDAKLINAMTRRHLTPEEDRAKGKKFLVFFRVERILPLIGDGEPEIETSP